MKLGDLHITDSQDYGDMAIAIDLLAFVDAKVQKLNNRRGERTAHVCIPIESNGIEVDGNEAIVFAFGKPTTIKGDYSHYIKQYLPSNVKKLLIKKGYGFKIIGKIKTK